MAAAFAALSKAREQREQAQEELKAAEVKMQRAFAAVDVDKSGKLDISEMMLALKRVGEYDAGDRKKTLRMEKLVTKEAGDDGEFSFREFKHLIEQLRIEKNKWNVPVRWLPNNDVAAVAYQLPVVQGFIAFVILANFLTMIIAAETDPYLAADQHYNGAWVAIDNTCNVIFTVELLFNLYGSFWRPFVVNPWNYLDTTVVIVGLLTMANVPLGPLANLKMLRAFRILRLFKRIKSLNKILVGIVRSIPGVMNAFVVMFIFMAIYAVLAVDLFREFGADGTYETIQRYGPADATWGAGAALADDATSPTLRVEERASVSSMTARGFHYGQEYFGTFSRSLYTLFQVLTGESWSEAVARPLIFGHPPENAIIAAVFFTSFILLTAIILQNVVVTVLLDNFLAGDSKSEADDANADAALADGMAGGSGALAPAPAMAPAGALFGSPASKVGSPSASPQKWSGAIPSPAEFAALRAQADQMQNELTSTLEQMKEILQLLPENSVIKVP